MGGPGSGHAKILIYNNKHCIFKRFSAPGIDRGRILNIKYRNVNSYDFKSDRFHKDDELVVIGEREWGMDLKTLMKYFYLRYFWYG